MNDYGGTPHLPSRECTGTHRYFVAETGTVEAEGKVSIIIVCTSCGEGKLLDFKVAGVTLKKEK